MTTPISGAAASGVGAHVSGAGASGVGTHVSGAAASGVVAHVTGAGASRCLCPVTDTCSQGGSERVSSQDDQVRVNALLLILLH